MALGSHLEDCVGLGSKGQKQEWPYLPSLPITPWRICSSYPCTSGPCKFTGFQRGALLPGKTAVLPTGHFRLLPKDQQTQRGIIRNEEQLPAWQGKLILIAERRFGHCSMKGSGSNIFGILVSWSSIILFDSKWASAAATT